MPVIVDFPFTRNIRSAAARKLLHESDGDTPVIEQPVRMVSCDTPEKAGFAGLPPTAQQQLDRCRQRLEGTFYNGLPKKLRQYLIGKLTADAAELHIGAGVRASSVFHTLLEQRLTRPDGQKRRVAIIPTGEIVDTHGRLLAYMAPYFAGSAADSLPPRDSPERRTFNLDMMENGWAAFFPIYPSLPRNPDMNLAIAAAEVAFVEQRGAWGEFGANILLAYEYRACIKLGRASTSAEGMREAFQRVCVDLRDLKLVGKHGFHKVPPPYRLWIWEQDLPAARVDLGLQA